MTSKERIVELIRNEFGLKDDVKFNIEGSIYNPFCFKKNKLFDKRGSRRAIATLLHYGDIEVIKEPLLTEEEKEYLKVVIKASDCVVHRVSQVPRDDCMRIYYEKYNSNGDYSEDLPTTKYQFNGLEGDILYTLEELGLTEPLDQESKSKER